MRWISGPIPGRYQTERRDDVERDVAEAPMAAGPQNLASSSREWKSSIPAASNLQRDYPFSALHGSANVLIFPDLDGAITQSILEQRVVSLEARGHAHTLAILTRHFPKIVLDCI